MIKNWVTYIAVLFLLLIGSKTGFIFAQPKEELRLIHAFQSEKSTTKQFSRLIALGEYYKTHNITKADSISHLILQKSRKLDTYKQYKALLFSIQIEEIQGKQEVFLNDILALAPFDQLLKDRDVHFQISKYLGYYYSSKLSFNEANNYLLKALQLAKKSRNNGNVAETYSKIAFNYMHANRKDSSFYFTDLAIQFARRSANKSFIAESFNTQALIYQYFGQVELSVSKNLIALQLATEANDYPQMARISRELGKSQLEINNLKDAEYFFNRSFEYAKQIHDQRQMGLALINLVGVFKIQKNYTKAIELSHKGIHFLEKLNDVNGLGEAYKNLGLVYTDQLKYDAAASNFNQALVYFESTGNKEEIADVYHNVGLVFFKKRQYNLALNYLNRSISIRQQFGSKSQVFNSYKIISDVYSALGKTKESLKYLQLYTNYLANNTSVQASTKIAELSELYRSEQRERLISVQADSIERQRQEKQITAAKLENTELKNNFQRYVIFAFIIIIILAGIIIYNRQNQLKIKQQQRDAEMSQTLLRSQMNPHFIFNAMSVIQSYIYENDIKLASRFLVNFSRLIRLILENSSKEFIPLSTEKEILQKYLETQKLRFEDRFDYFLEIDDLLFFEQAMIPPMITQPFIENAIEHGQLHTVEGGFIKIVIAKMDNMLTIEIIDNGIGRTNSEKNKKSSDHTSMAMDITKKRINMLNFKYKTEGYMLVEDFDKALKTGTKVLLSLPYHIDKN